MTIMYVSMTICNILQPFGTFFPILVHCIVKNLASLVHVRAQERRLCSNPLFGSFGGCRFVLCAERLCQGLPDGSFSNQKIPIWANFARPKNEKMLVYFKFIWNILQAFGIF
jgi:hypothetical protein